MRLIVIPPPSLFCSESLLKMVPKAEALLQEQPSWPSATALLSFSLPLKRYTSLMKLFSKFWIPRFFVLRNGRLYYSDGRNGHPDSKEGTLSFVRSNPAPNTRYCVELKGMRTFAACITVWCLGLIGS